MGFSEVRRCRGLRELLPPFFTLTLDYRSRQGRYLFCGTFHQPVKAVLPLGGIPPCGARTFLFNESKRLVSCDRASVPLIAGFDPLS